MPASSRRGTHRRLKRGSASSQRARGREKQDEDIPGCGCRRVGWFVLVVVLAVSSVAACLHAHLYVLQTELEPGHTAQQSLRGVMHVVQAVKQGNTTVAPWKATPRPDPLVRGEDWIRPTVGFSVPALGPDTQTARLQGVADGSSKLPAPKLRTQRPSSQTLQGPSETFRAVRLGEPGQPQCTWTEHPGKYLGEYAGGETKVYMNLVEVLLRCEEILGLCQGVTCELDRGCTVRAGVPYLAPSQTREISFALNACQGKPVAHNHGQFPSPGLQQGSLDDKPAGQPGSVEEQERRAQCIRNAIRHAWIGYRSKAWGMDCVNPVSGRPGLEKFRLAITMVDSLDTLWLAGFKAEFAEAQDWLTKNLPHRISTLRSQPVNIFETTIRVLGGLEAAHALSEEPVFLDLAKKLAGQLLSRTSHDGVTPYTMSGSAGGMQCPSLAESGTNQVEMRYLSQVTGDKSYEQKVFRFYNFLRNRPSIDGLRPNCYSRTSGKITFGADGDSYYEYLLKAWLQGGRSEDYLWEMYNSAVDGLRKHVAKINPQDSLTYLADLMWKGGDKLVRLESMEHLTCFTAGWLALGAPYQSNVSRKEEHLRLADSIAYTCWQMYERQPTGIAPERVKGMRMDLSATDTKEYILRPEAMEAWWYMYRRTGDQKYREWGWKAFLAFERELKVAFGYASLRDVSRRQQGPGKYLDRMESFFIAETLKYAFLLQLPDDPVPLDEWVFNTEGHPLKIHAPRAPPGVK